MTEYTLDEQESKKLTIENHAESCLDWLKSLQCMTKSYADYYGMALDYGNRATKRFFVTSELIKTISSDKRFEKYLFTDGADVSNA